MKPFILLVSGLLCLLGQSRPLAAQDAAPAANDSLHCQDFVYLRNGNVFRGEIRNYQPGQSVTLKTSFGQEIIFEEKNVRRIVQRCRDNQVSGNPMGIKPYHFRERGWYNLTRAAVLGGSDEYGDPYTGFMLHHSAGYALRRQLAFGLGTGIEHFRADGGVATYPVYAEVRGYLLARRLTPFWAAGGGWAFAGEKGQDRWGYEDSWKGGWMSFAQLGYRLGNHFVLYGGVRFQHMRRNWNSLWAGDQFGQDRILHRRLEFGAGLLL